MSLCPFIQFSVNPDMMLELAGIMRILVVEDDQQLAGFLCRGLEEEGSCVTVAHDGATAAQLAAAHTFDVIVLDIMLPFLDGLETTRRIRRTRQPNTDPAFDGQGFFTGRGSRTGRRRGRLPYKAVLARGVAGQTSRTDQKGRRRTVQSARARPI